MTSKVNITINGTPLAVDKGTTILDAAKLLGIKIPVLCYHKDLCIAGNCRVCVVEVVGVSKLFAACATPVWEGMEVLTNSLLVRNSRKHIIELLLSEHNADCTKCYRNGNCELQDLSAEYKLLISISSIWHIPESTPLMIFRLPFIRTTAGVSVARDACAHATNCKALVPLQ